jgi:hypothetical protein
MHSILQLICGYFIFKDDVTVIHLLGISFIHLTERALGAGGWGCTFPIPTAFSKSDSSVESLNDKSTYSMLKLA